VFGSADRSEGPSFLANPVWLIFMFRRSLGWNTHCFLTRARSYNKKAFGAGLDFNVPLLFCFFCPLNLRHPNDMGPIDGPQCMKTFSVFALCQYSSARAHVLHQHIPFLQPSHEYPPLPVMREIREPFCEVQSHLFIDEGQSISLCLGKILQARF